MPTAQCKCDKQKLNGTGCTSIKEIRIPAGSLCQDTATLSGGEPGESVSTSPWIGLSGLEVTDILRIPFGVFPATIACGPLGSVMAIMPLDNLFHAAHLHLVIATGPWMRTGP